MVRALYAVREAGGTILMGVVPAGNAAAKVALESERAPNPLVVALSGKGTTA